jgi:hypothetical protein
MINKIASVSRHSSIPSGYWSAIFSNFRIPGMG